MNPLDLVKLTPLMQPTVGRAELKVALIDGPVAMDHPDLRDQNIQNVAGSMSGTCSQANGPFSLMLRAYGPNWDQQDNPYYRPPIQVQP